MSESTKACALCGTQFAKLPHKSDRYFRERKFCSLSCASKSRELAPWATCSVDGCERRVRHRTVDLCRMHLQRERRWGDPLTVDPRSLESSKSPMRRLLEAISDDSNCWVWGRRSRTGFGYGTLSLGRSHRVGAHVLMYELYHGVKIAPGMCVCHSCDNPPCINPNHLWLGTPADNAADMARKGRAKKYPSPWCSVDGCDRPYIAKGLCSHHYDKARRSAA